MANSYKAQVTAAEQAIQRIISALKPLDDKLLNTIALMRQIPDALTPSKTAEQLEKYTKRIDSLEKQVKKLTETQIKLNDAQKVRNTLTGKENANNAILARNNNLVTLSTSKLAGAYGNLNAKLRLAKKRLQDLMIEGRKASQSQREYNKQLRVAQKEFDGLNRKANAAKRAVSNFKNTSLGGLVRSARNLVSAFGIIGGSAIFASLVKDVFKLTKSLDSLTFTMRAVITDEIELEQTQRFLKQITKDYGAELITVTNRFIKFRAASQQAGLSAKETQKIFGTFTKTAGILGLKTDELQGIFLALEQMISKGKITTEELRRQLGERLPGAMDIMANSLNVTTSELDAMLKKGEVITKEVLPGFAREVEKAFGLDSFTKVTTLQAATVRLKNAWTIIVDEFGKANSISEKLRKAIDFLADNLKKILSVIFKVIKAFIVYKIVVIGLTLAVKAYTIVVSGLTILNKALAKSTNIATVAMKAFNLAVKTTPIGVIIAIVGAVAAAFVFLKDNVSDAQKELQDFNDELERLGNFGEKVGKSLDNVANGTERVNAATSRIFVIYDTLNTVLEKEIKHIEDANDRLAFKNELIEKITNQRGLDSKAAKKFADEEFGGFSKVTRKRIAEAIIGANQLNRIIDESRKFQENKDKEKEEFDEKAAEKLRKSAFNLAKFRIQQEINANKAILADNEASVEVLQNANSNLIQNSIALAELEADFKKKTAKVNANDLKLIAEELEAKKTAIWLKGISDRERITLESNQKIKQDWQDIQDELESAELGEIFEEDIGGLMSKLAKDTGIPVKELFAEFRSLYKQDYDDFLKFLKKKKKDTDDDVEEQKENRVKALEAANEFTDALGELGSTFFDARIQRYDDEIQKNNDFYAQVLANETLSLEQTSFLEAERDKKNAEFEKKKRAEQRKQAIVNKATALVEIAINTAIAVTRVVAQTGLLGLLTGVPAMIALGAIQAAIVIAQPIPKFEKGKGDYDNYEGWGVWGEKRREAKISTDGSIELSPKKIGDHLTHVKKDDIIHPNADKLLKQLALSDIDMNPYIFSQPNMSSYLMMGDLFVDRIDTQTNRMVDAINKKKMSFKLSQTISLADDIAFLISKKDTL